VHDRVNIECDMIGKYIVRAAELGEIGPDRRGRSTAH
jgi:riboflavin synthase alpha subunit